MATKGSRMEGKVQETEHVSNAEGGRRLSALCSELGPPVAKADPHGFERIA